jgi:hypothetical protein
LIVLIANAHLYLGLEFLIFLACAQKGSKPDQIDKPELAEPVSPSSALADKNTKDPVTFYNRANQIPLTCSI